MFGVTPRQAKRKGGGGNLLKLIPIFLLLGRNFIRGCNTKEKGEQDLGRGTSKLAKRGRDEEDVLGLKEWGG